TALDGTGQVAGRSDYYLNGHYQGYHAFLWNAGTLYDLNNYAPAGWTFQQASAINDYGQVAGYGTHNGSTEAFLFTPQPDWQGGNGYWSDASRWNYGGMGAFGFTPGLPHDVVINPAGSAMVYGPTDATVHSLSVSGSGGNLVTLSLNGGGIATTAGTTLGSNGTLTGSGRLTGNLAIQAGGRAYVGSGQSMQLAGAVTNAGRIDAQPATGGRSGLEIGATLTNASGGEVNLMNADLFVHGGTVNGGRISIAGFTQVSGSVDNQAGGQVNVSGTSAQAIFWDNFRNNGSVNVTTGSTATFFGLVTGAGSFLGGGAKELAGGYSPGNSPAQVTLDGSVSFTAGTLTMELGGTTPGSGHDKLVFLGSVALNGAGLSVEYWNGWTAGAGQTYDLFDWNSGAPQGSFSQVLLPTLAAGLVWDTSHLYTSGDISVAAVPEPETYATLLAGLGILAAVARRRQG
ncbi:MAG TPA: PEP-CTERM sorting domain-containing protein, partial [Rhodocyclaceae bacterium]|nr:PEP-CTERM sorting domain-containing protein [Rhodocyclaceae bacterium]